MIRIMKVILASKPNLPSSKEGAKAARKSAMTIEETIRRYEQLCAK